MVKNILKYTVCMLFACSILSCSNEETVAGSNEGKQITLTVGASDNSMSTRTVYDAVNNNAKWGIKESIGVAAYKNDAFTDAKIPEFVGNNDAEARSAQFSGTLTDKGTGNYTLYGIYPYQNAMYTNGDISVNLNMLQYPTATSWDPTTDFMVGKSGTETNATGIAGITDANKVINFKHLLGWLKLSFSGFNNCTVGEQQNVDCTDDIVKYVRISTGHEGKAIAGDFKISLLGESISTTDATDKFIIADYSDKNITLGGLTAILTLLPNAENETYATVDIAVKTDKHYIECTRSNLVITASKINEATVNYSNGATVKTSQEDLCEANLPSMSSKTEGSLNVLLLGHSFGIDCTEHLPGLLQVAGITNLNLCRFHQNDCQLNEYWQFITTKTPPQQYYWCENSQWKVNGATKINDKLIDTAWDVVIMQQSTCDGRSQTAPDWGGAANYSTYQPWLSLLLEYIVTTQKTRKGKTPYIAWNMIHSSRTSWQDKYDKIVEATTSMQAETGIKLILTPSTAMQTARLTQNSTTFGFDFSDANTYHILCRDINGPIGWHASEGLGRYLMACTWFEQLIVPIYKNANVTTVVGNEYRPAETVKSFEEDVVTAEKAAALQNIAYDTKTNNPFSSSNPQ